MLYRTEETLAATPLVSQHALPHLFTPPRPFPTAPRLLPTDNNTNETVAAVSWRRQRQQGREVNDFIENVRGMYKQGQQAALSMGGEGGVGDVIDANGTPPAPRYDPKARVFVGECCAVVSTAAGLAT